MKLNEKDQAIVDTILKELVAQMDGKSTRSDADEFRLDEQRYDTEMRQVTEQYENAWKDGKSDDRSIPPIRQNLHCQRYNF